MGSLKDIHWIASPLGLEHRARMNKTMQNLRKGAPQLPVDTYDSFRAFYHWTLEIDGIYYELYPHINRTVDAIKHIRDLCVPRWVDRESWYKPRIEANANPKRKKIGQTRKTHEEILQEVDFVWDDFHHKHYNIFVANCQNFVVSLYSRITTSNDDAEISEVEKSCWLPLPRPISYALSNASKGGLVSGTGLGTIDAYLVALAELGQLAEAGETIAGVTAAGGASFDAAALAASHGAAAAGGTGTVGSAGAATAGTASAGTATTAGTTATGGAAGSTTTGAATATESTSQAAAGATKGSIATTKGGVAGATKTSGLSAKLAALGGHSTVHAAGAAKLAGMTTSAKLGVLGTGMAKAGAATAVVNPPVAIATGATAAGLLTLAYLGKGDRGWVKRVRGRKAPGSKAGSKKGSDAEERNIAGPDAGSGSESEVEILEVDEEAARDALKEVQVGDLVAMEGAMLGQMEVNEVMKERADEGGEEQAGSKEEVGRKCFRKRFLKR